MGFKGRSIRPRCRRNRFTTVRYQDVRIVHGWAWISRVHNEVERRSRGGGRTIAGTGAKRGAGGEVGERRKVKERGERGWKGRKGQRRDAVGGRSGYGEVCGTRGYSSLSGFHPGRLCMEMPPLNNPPPLTSAQWSSHYVASESTNAGEASFANAISFSLPLLPLFLLCPL